MCIFAAAVCDFCKKKESELYQKEVKWQSRIALLYQSVGRLKKKKPNKI